jgi:hypothetical protein
VGSIWAINESIDAGAESEDVAEYFSSRMAPAVQRQMAVQMEWLESKEVITARGFAEFRNKTLSLYQSRVRSMTVEASRQCEFLHHGFVETGRWYGQCADGRATGKGYGVVSDGVGSSVEFIGNTVDGLASGTGAMIIRPAGHARVTYLEGSFKSGQPDGVVIVEETGKQQMLRAFTAGQDRGKGDANRLQKLSFSSEWSESGMLNP